MTTEQKQIKDWMTQFGQATPEKPTIPDLPTRKLRAKLIFEEYVKELIKALGFSIQYRDKQTGEVFKPMFFHEVEFFEEYRPNLIEIADGCSDGKVVTEGTLVACGLVSNNVPFNSAKFEDNTDPFFNEVMRSNFSKLWTKNDIELQIDKLIEQGATLLAYDTENPSEHNNIPLDKELLPFIRGDIKHVVKDRDGKVIKNPSYSPANFQPIIDEMSK